MTRKLKRNFQGYSRMILIRVVGTDQIFCGRLKILKNSFMVWETGPGENATKSGWIIAFPPNELTAPVRWFFWWFKHTDSTNPINLIQPPKFGFQKGLTSFNIQIFAWQRRGKSEWSELVGSIQSISWLIFWTIVCQNSKMHGSIRQNPMRPIRATFWKPKLL